MRGVNSLHSKIERAAKVEGLPRSILVFSSLIFVTSIGAGFSGSLTGPGGGVVKLGLFRSRWASSVGMGMDGLSQACAFCKSGWCV